MELLQSIASLIHHTVPTDGRVAKDGRSPSTASPRKVVRYYEAAKPDRVLDNHFVGASTESASSLISASLTTLRNRVRYEVRNNSYAAGIVQTLAADVVGTGPTLTFVDDREALEDDFAGWCQRCDWLGQQNLGAMLRLAVIGFCEAGEAFFVKYYNQRGDLQLLQVEPDRIATPHNMTGDDSVRDGIKIDDTGRVQGYYVLKHHPGDSHIFAANDDYTFVPPEQMIHLLRIDRPGQHRGVPWLSPAIGLFAMMRDFTRATLKSAKRAADLSMIMSTTLPELLDNDDYEAPATFDEIEMPEDAGLTLPEGWTATQLKSEHPSTTYEMFKKEILNEIGRCISMPLNIATCNSSKYNYASGQLDHLTYQRAIEVIRGLITDRLLDVVTMDRLRLLRLVPGVVEDAADPLQHQWCWTNRGFAEPAKAAKAQTEKIANGLATMAGELAGTGQSWRQVIKQQGLELEAKKAAGLEQEPTPPTEDETESDDDDEQSQEDSEKSETESAKS